jgi:integrase
MAEDVYPYTLADGAIRFYVMYRTSNGVLRKRRGFVSEREAVRWRTQTLAAVYRGEVLAARGTFTERLDPWLEEHRPRIEPGTYRDYRNHGDKRLKPFFGGIKPAGITPSDVRRYVAQLVARGEVSAKTINNSLAVLRVFFAHLEEDGDVVRNPARSSAGGRERIKLPAAHREMDYLRPDEIPRYLDACDDLYRPLAEALIATGVRISEALALTWPTWTARRAACAWCARARRRAMGRRRATASAPSTSGHAWRRYRVRCVRRTRRSPRARSCSAARAAASCRARTSRATCTSTRPRTPASAAACACTTCAIPRRPRGWPPACR